MDPSSSAALPIVGGGGHTCVAVYLRPLLDVVTAQPNNGTTSLVDNRVEHEVTIAPKEQDIIVSIVASPSKKTTPSKPLRLCSKVRTCNRDKTKKKRGDKSNKDKVRV